MTTTGSAYHCLLQKEFMALGCTIATAWMLHV
ncbi:hypothetical protein P879_11349 [Paragonimus westermani]|uniref:Uncharacterized protein n=1 Tax=Paragonimus westermani TaxID=34504 RepID=A0A8T0DEV1_9TREM|nr:hypothetical protein P879_11349 [Paragonimus westermani]